MGLFGKLKEVLRKTKESLSKKLVELFAKNKLGDEFYEELEDILISSDVSVKTAMNIVENIRDVAIEEKCRDKDYVVKLLKDELYDTLTEAEEVQITPPAVIMMVGVNGVGKTTTIGKLAHYFLEKGKSVTVAAADTFRAAASEQLAVWAERAKVRIVKHEEGSDPAAVIFDAVSSAKAKGTDVVIVDTAGLDGLVLTKLDGTAKGGFVFSLAAELALPVIFAGVGEKMEDLERFDAKSFVEAIL